MVRILLVGLILFSVGSVGAFGQQADTAGSAVATPLSCEPERVPESGAAFPDLYCIELHAAPGIRDASGIVRLRHFNGPFGVSVTREGSVRYTPVAVIDGLPPLESSNQAYVVWAVTPVFDQEIRIGTIGENGTFELEPVAFDKFLILVTEEESARSTSRQGRLIMRGQSPSNVLQPHDILSLTPLAAFAPRDGSHHHHEWGMPPDHPRVPMAPGMAGIVPNVAPYLPSADPDGIPVARPRELLHVAGGDTVSLTAGPVRRSIRGKDLIMYGFNGQYPGPLIHVAEKATITVLFKNELELPTAVHWHGIRLDNRFDGVPGLTQDPVHPGESFEYTIHFPDAGIFWYHPHHREDIQQDLGLYGNILVQPSDPSYFNSVDREEVLILDDLLLGDEGLVPYGRESANFMLMGRFGNVFLVNGEPDYATTVGEGEVVRFFLTNVSNTRTFNLSFGSLVAKVVGSDVGKFEREAWAGNVVIAPAERYIVEIRFDEPGIITITNEVKALNHQTGLFFPEIDTLGVIEVEARDRPASVADEFETLHENPDVVAEIDAFREHFDRPVDREMVMTMRVDDLPLVVSQMMRLDPIYFNPVEWSDTMPMMNWIATGNEVTWILRDPETGLENMDVVWSLRRGDVAKIRVHNDRNAFHAMQHPLHFHGQRFLILERDGVPNDNLVWKDTVVVPVGSTVDLLVELSNPGKWMVHCHIAEHLSSGMMMVLNVTE